MNSVIVSPDDLLRRPVFLLVVMMPWNNEDVHAGPFVAAFKAMGLPYADHVMNAVVLTAVLSCLNSGLYTALAHALRARGPA